MKYDIRLAVADDHEIFLDGLALMLSRQEHITLVGQASDGRELVELVNAENPDVVMTDIKMPRMDGIAATRMLGSKIVPRSCVSACSMMARVSSPYPT